MTQLQQTLTKSLSALSIGNVMDTLGVAILSQICGEQSTLMMAVKQAVQESSQLKSPIGFWDIQRIIDAVSKIEDQAYALKEKLNKIQEAIEL